MSYSNQQQTPVGVPPLQGYPPPGYSPPVYPPQQYTPQYAPPPTQQTGFLGKCWDLIWNCFKENACDCLEYCCC